MKIIRSKDKIGIEFEEIEAKGIFTPYEMRHQSAHFKSIMRLIKKSGLENEIAIDALPGREPVLTDLAALRDKIAVVRTRMAAEQAADIPPMTVSLVDAARFLECTINLVKHFAKSGVLSNVPHRGEKKRSGPPIYYAPEVFAIRDMYIDFDPNEIDRMRQGPNRRGTAIIRPQSDRN